MRLTKKLLSAFLALVMVFTMLPVQAFASETVSDGTRFQGVVGESRPQKAPAVENSVRSITIKVGETSESFPSLDTSGYPKRWITTNATVATVTGNSDGSATITGVTPGIGTIKEERNEKKAWEPKDRWVTVQTIKVEVVTNVAGISLPAELVFNDKNPQKLTPTLQPEDSRGYTIIWTVDNDAIAKVDAHGNVTPVAPGETFVTAAVNDTDYSATCKIVVTEVGIEGIELQDWELVVGSTGKMPITYSPAEPFNPQLTWQIDDLNIATIYPNGTILANKAGTTTVTVTYGNISDTATLTVTERGPEAISLNQDSFELNGLKSVQLTATVSPDKLSDALRVITWESTNPSVATVDKTGMVHAVAPGNTTITATTVNGHQKTCSITVKQCPDSGSTAVYVYLNIVVRDGVSMDDWQINGTGEWYTIGKINVPTSVLRPASEETEGEGVARNASMLMPYLPYIDLNTVNQDVASGVTLQDCRWELRWTGNGANDYPAAPNKTWHLDGFLVLRNTQHTLKVKYQDTFGNTLKTELVIPNIKVGSVQPVEIPKIDGYKPIKFGGYSIPEGQTQWNVNISGDKEIVIQYQGEKTNYTRKHIDMATGKAIAEDETFEAKLGETVTASKGWAKTIPYFTFTNGISPSDMTIGQNPSANVFTLYYTRNQHTVTYKYIDPTTGKEGIVGPETKGAGLEVNAEKIPNIPGYTFNGWEDTAETGKVKIENGKFIMPDRDVTFTGSFSVPDSQKYAVRANIYLGNGNNKQLLGTVDEVEISFAVLQERYKEAAYQLANRYWKVELTGNDEMLPAQWNPSQPDAGKMYTSETDENGFHIVNIHLKETSPALVTLTYDANGEGVTNMPNQQSAKYLKGTEVTVASAPARENYTFTGWNTAADGSDAPYLADGKIKLTDNTTLYAQWTANTAEYKVQYLFQTANGSGYEQRSDVEGYTASGNIGDKITPLKLAEDKIPTGFAYESHDANVEISADGKAVAQVYYDRNVHNVVYKITGEYFANDRYRTDEGICFGAELPAAPEDMDKAGYVWSGWSERPGTMPDKNVEVTGSYSLQTGLPYTVKYIWNGEILDTVPGTGTFGDPIDPEVKPFDGYTFKEKDKDFTITADPIQNVVNVYYYKNVTLKANSDNNRIYNGETQTAKPGYESSEKNAVFEGIVPTGSGKDAKEYPVAFPANTLNTVDKTKLYIVTEVKDGKLTINPKAVTLRTESASKDYDGTALTKDGVAGRDGFVTGDVTTVRATGTQTLVGESKNTIEIVWAGDALAKNYTITEDLGTLTVTAPETFDYVQKDANNEKFAIGEKVTFTITVTNIYDVPATVVLEEQVGMTFEGGETKLTTGIPAGETREFTVSYVVTEADVEAGEIANKVTWTLTPNGTDVPPVDGGDESIIKNESYLVWYVLEGDTEGCINLDTMPKQANHKYGTTVTVWMPELAEGYKFSGWMVDGEPFEKDSFDMPENAVILTGTISKEQVKVDYKAQEGGLITDSNGLSNADLAEMVPYGENAKGATASAKKGYTFVEWQDANHKQVSTDPEFIPTNVTAPATYYAVFAKQKVKVEYTADLGGFITSPSGAAFGSVIEQVTYGENAVGATASAKPGYYFVHWLDAEGNEVGTELHFAPENVTEEAVYKAVFAKYYAVNYVPVGTPEGTVLPQSENPYREGDEVVLMDAPKVDGYKFAGWYKDAGCTEKAENFVMPAEDVTIYGKFERAYKVTYRLTDGISEMGVRFTIPDDFKPIDPAQYKPGEEVKVADEQILHDLDFTGWYCVEGNVKVEDGVFTMPAEDVVFEGGYVIRAYGVRHYFQDLYNPEKYIEQKNMSDFFLANGMEMTTAVALPAEWTPNLHALPFEQLPILPFQETVVKIKYDRDWYDVTYQLEGDVIPAGFTVPETKQHAYTATVTVAKAPQIEGYTFSGWTTEDATVANGKFAMPNNAVTLTGKFELATDTKYTVEHYFENLGGGYPAEPNHTESKVGTTSQRTEAMPIPAGSITGFTVDGSWKQQTIKPDGSTVVKIYYTRNSYNLTIHYRNVGGAEVADSHHGTYKFGETWKIVSPIVAGYYDPQIRSISSGANGMPAQDLEYVVIYTVIPAPVDPDPEGPNPGPNVPDDDDDDDDTPPVPDPEQEQPPQPQDFEIDPDDYTLTEVEDNETPLANLDLEGHTCCILHLLLMLAAMVVLGFDTKSRKKHQARIFELKKMLAMEEDHSDDPEQP